MSIQRDSTKKEILLDDWVQRYGRYPVERFYPSYLAKVFDMPLIHVYERLALWVSLGYLVHEYEVCCPDCTERVELVSREEIQSQFGRYYECLCGGEFECSEERIFPVFKFNKDHYEWTGPEQTKKVFAPASQDWAGQGASLAQVMESAREAGAPFNVFYVTGTNVVNNGQMIINRIEVVFDSLVSDLRGECKDETFDNIADDYTKAPPVEKRKLLGRMLGRCKEMLDVYETGSRVGRLVTNVIQAGNALLEAYQSAVPVGTSVPV